jgi:hypothetical protein
VHSAKACLVDLKQFLFQTQGSPRQAGGPSASCHLECDKLVTSAAKLTAMKPCGRGLCTCLYDEDAASLWKATSVRIFEI